MGSQKQQNINLSPKSVSAFDLFIFFRTDLIQSEASWKLSSTSDWLMSAWRKVSWLKEVTLLGSLLQNQQYLWAFRSNDPKTAVTFAPPVREHWDLTRKTKQWLRKLFTGAILTSLQGCGNCGNRPVPRSKNSHFQSEAKQSLSYENVFYLHENRKPFL